MAKFRPPWGSLGKFDLDPVSIFQLVSVAKPNVGSDLDYVPRVMAGVLRKRLAGKN
jgi:hypothetical protein